MPDRMIAYQDVALHCIDWGGDGPPMVLLAGLGNSAHVFDEFATRFLDSFRVVGVTRVGYGASSHPDVADAYSLAVRVEQLRAVLDAFEFPQSILVGHSIAGDELTAFAAAYPERVRAVIYLDAAYDHTAGERWQAALAEFLAGRPPLIEADRASASAMQQYLWAVQGMRLPITEMEATSRFDETGRFVGSRTAERVRSAMKSAVTAADYTRLRSPAFALYSLAVDASDRLPWLRADSIENARATEALRRHVWSEQEAERERFAREVPRAHVESIVAHHYAFLSHPAEVEARMRAFLGAPASDRVRLERERAMPALEPPLRVGAPKHTAHPLPDALRRAADGTYELALPGGKLLPLVLRDAEERVTIQLGAQPALPLIYLGDGSFGAAFDPAFRLHVFIDEQPAERVELRQGGHVLSGRRRG